jgi:hypothetical protein
MEPPANYWFVRLFFQRGLAVVYLIAFLVAVNQFRPLAGEHGLLPVPRFVGRVDFQQTPSLFFLWPRDTAFTLFAWLGVGLSVLALAGISERYGWWLSVAVWALLWAIYLSFVNVGQTFYAFGWESMLLEAGFLAIFMGPSRYAPSVIPIWLVRWMEFRVMFGAGLIKLRGDPCWKTLTCLDDFYETQPMPNPLSWYFHHLPQWVHHGGVLFNHFTELIVPFAYFLPQPVAGIAAAITILFQLTLMLGGNLSFLNLLTIVLAIPALDGRWLARLAPVHIPELIAASRGATYVTIGLAVLVGILSINPVLNLISSRQMMNTSFEPLHLVNTYGAFGSITKPRYEVMVEGTADAVPGVPGGKWLAYEFKGKPGDPTRMPPQIAPYHLRLDWLMWFAAMGRYTDYPWFVNFTAKLLQNDPAVLSLLRSNPFPDRPPRYVRAMLYRYRFSTPEERSRTSAWWQREEEGPWFPAVSLDTPGFRQLLIDQGWM